jgi:ABC-2 type transport system permease protein
MLKIKTIILKEWAEVFKRRMVLFTVIFMPMLFSALPLIMLYVTRDAGVDELTSDMPAQFTSICPEGLTEGACFQVYLVYQFMILFMMIPLIIPVNMAAYSIVGEKTTRSLEPLLATPITIGELLTGKNLAAAIPAILATWAGFIVFAVGSFLIVKEPQIINALLNPMWLLAIGVAGPLMAFLSVNFSLLVSSRVNDPRVAEQLSVIVILLVLALFFGQVSGFLLINESIVLFLIVGLIIVDLIMIYITIHLFQRETILIRWK